MQSIRCPETVFGSGHRDYRIQKPPGLLDDARQPLVMRFGKIALKWRRLNTVDGEDGEQKRMASKRIAIGCQNRAAFTPHARCYRLQIFGDIALAVEWRK